MGRFRGGCGTASQHPQPGITISSRAEECPFLGNSFPLTSRTCCQPAREDGACGVPGDRCWAGCLPRGRSHTHTQAKNRHRFNCKNRRKGSRWRRSQPPTWLNPKWRESLRCSRTTAGDQSLADSPACIGSSCARDRGGWKQSGKGIGNCVGTT